MSKNKKIIPIKPELRGLITEFLDYDEYQIIFKKFSKVLGYNGNKVDKIKQVLFIPNDKGEILFAIEGMYDLFTEYQLLKQLVDKEPYKTLLTEYPEAIRNIRVLAIKMLNGEKIGEEDLMAVFTGYDDSSSK